MVLKENFFTILFEDAMLYLKYFSRCNSQTFFCNVFNIKKFCENLKKLTSKSIFFVFL